MGRMVIVVSLISFFVAASICSAVCEKTEPLFVIERSKNGNTVHYDACIDRDDVLSDAGPVLAYWVMEDGQREDLIRIERERAYGVIVRERGGRRKVVFSVVSLKEREIKVEKIGRRYRAIMSIGGKECILERIYLKSRELLFGPIVEYVDIYGRTKAGNHAVTERLDKPRM